MVGGVTVQAFDGSGAGRAFMRGGTTLVASRTLLAEFRAVSKALTVVAAQRVGDEDADLVADMTSEKCIRQLRGVESDDEKTGVAPLAVTEGSEPAHMRHALWAETIQDVLFGHVPHLRGKDSALRGVSCMM